MAQCWSCGSEINSHASRCNECGRNTTLSAFIQIASLGVLIVAALMVGGVMPTSALSLLIPGQWLDRRDSPLPQRHETGVVQASGAGAGGGGGGPAARFGYGAAPDAESEAPVATSVPVSEKHASTDPACNSEGAIRRLAERHPDWARGDLSLIACDRIRNGFSAEQVLEALGRPVRKQSASGSVAEVWIYRDTRVVLERGSVVSIRE